MRLSHPEHGSPPPWERFKAPAADPLLRHALFTPKRVNAGIYRPRLAQSRPKRGNWPSTPNGADRCKFPRFALNLGVPPSDPCSSRLFCDANDFGRSSDIANRRWRPARHAGAVRAAPCSGVPVRAPAGTQRSDGGRLDQRGVPRRLAASRKVRGPFRRLDMDAEHRAVQSAVGITAPAGGRTG